MALDNILTYATSINLSESKTIYRAISNGGVGRTMSASPLFYYVDVALRPMYLAEYKLIQNDMRELDYGVNIVETSLPHGFTYTANTISTAPTVNTTNAQGTNIAVSTGHGLEAGDWVQFTYADATQRGARKAYQLTSVTASSITLNTGLIIPPAGAPALGSDIITGSDIVLRVIAQDIPAASSVPGRGGDPLYSFSGSFKFREVL